MKYLLFIDHFKYSDTKSFKFVLFFEIKDFKNQEIPTHTYIFLKFLLFLDFEYSDILLFKTKEFNLYLQKCSLLL